MCLATFACARSKTPKPNAEAVPPPAACVAQASWITAPAPPAEVGGPGVPVTQETNCQFYQFAYQWFFSLVQPAGASGESQFETLNVYQPKQTNQCAMAKKTGRANAVKALFVRSPKTDAADFNPVVPEDILQATAGPLYDQNGNVVLYCVLYNSTECQATAASYLPNTIEIKTSWKILKTADPAYYSMTATVPGISKSPIILGLVGFHLVINTKLHPEFVWATFEHVNNAPDCANPQPAPAAGWSFLSSACAACLKQNGVNGCPQCNFNQGATPPPPPGITGTPNQVCRVFPLGTDPGSMTNGNNNDTNRFTIQTLNTQLAGFFAQLPAGSPMAVWKNYTLVGGLWTNGGVGSGGTTVQRGPLEAANLTMETFFQNGNQSNCFTRHNYHPARPLQVSHIISNLLPPGVVPKQAKAQK